MPSYRHLSHRALAALAIVSLSASLAACGSKGAKPSDAPAPARPADTSSVAVGGGKSMENLLAGRFPGVNVTSAPGGGIMVRIRGGGSGGGYSSDEPLILVDESPLPPGSNGIVYLNPNDIEKIEVLKRPEEVGVYGIRGANGVIKITTKRPGRR